MFFFFFKQKTAYEMRISDWSSDVCSSDLGLHLRVPAACVMAEMDAGLEELAHRERRNCHVCVSFPVVPPRDVTLFHGRNTAPERAATIAARVPACEEIGRASCRERVCQDV